MTLYDLWKHCTCYVFVKDFDSFYSGGALGDRRVDTITTPDEDELPMYDHVIVVTLKN